MRIRRAIIADIPAIIAVDLSAGQLFSGTHMDWAVGEASDLAELYGPIRSGHVWVAEEGEDIAAYLAGEPVEDVFHIEEVAVSAHFQRRGIGRMLIEKVENVSRSKGLTALTLTTDRILPWNAPYYERIGFVILSADDLTPSLAAQLASKPNPALRCAMKLSL